MSLIYTSKPYTQESKRQALNTLLDNITPDRDFYVLLVGAALLAIGGIFLDSVPVLIASMIVAPLASPILGLGLGVASRSLLLICQSIAILVVSFVIAFGLAIVTTKIFGNLRVDNIFVSFSSNRYLATSIAVIAGAIAAYGLVRPKVNGAITGVAIAVSLMPPLVATGIELTSHKTVLAERALTIFGLNVVGILVASVVVFVMLGVAREYRLLQKS